MSLQSLISILLARKWALIHITLLALVMALVAIVITPKTYTASTDLLVDGRGLDPISGQSQPGRLTGGYTATQADIIRSRNVASKVIEKLALQQSPAMIKAAKLSGDPVQDKGRMLYFLAQGLMVVPKRDSSVLSITFQAQDPIFAAQLADAFAQAYMYTTLELRVEPAKQTSLWYKEQLTGLRAELIEKQDALSNYQEAHNIIATSDRLDLESAKLAELSSMLITVQSERLNSQSRSDQIEGTKRGQAEFQALNNPQVQRLSADLAQAQARVSELANQVGENHPQYKQAQSDVSSLQKQMNKMLEMINGSLKSSVALSQTLEDQLKTDIAEQKARVLLLSRNRNELTLLKQEVDNAQSAYDAALARSAQSRLESQIAATDVAVLNSALPPRSPTSPKPALALTLACIAGLLLGTALALCWEWLDQRIRTPADLEEGLGLAVLAYIPAEFPQKYTRPGLASPS